MAAFHTSAPREEEAKPVVPEPVTKGGLLGTGINEWFALPVGIAVAVPAVTFDWYVINEETQLMAVFVAFCVTFYTQAGDAIYKSLDASGKAVLKEQNEAEDKYIEAVEQKLDFLKANGQQVEHFEAINAIREDTYTALNAAGAIKPQHDFKLQVEKVLNMIAAEETSITEKSKIALMTEATESVTERFTSEKALKKAAMDSAVAAIKGASKGKGADPVQAAFIKFFKEKGAAAAKGDSTEEEAAARVAMVAKLNSMAKNEKMFFEFDDSGQVKMTI